MMLKKLATFSEWDCKFIYNTYKPDWVLEKTVDGSKGSQLLDWNPSIPLDDGIKLTVDWYLKYGKQERH